MARRLVLPHHRVLGVGLPHNRAVAALGTRRPRADVAPVGRHPPARPSPRQPVDGAARPRDPHGQVAVAVAQASGVLRDPRPVERRRERDERLDWMRGGVAARAVAVLRADGRAVAHRRRVVRRRRRRRVHAHHHPAPVGAARDARLVRERVPDDALLDKRAERARPRVVTQASAHAWVEARAWPRSTIVVGGKFCGRTPVRRKPLIDGALRLDVLGAWRTGGGAAILMGVQEVLAMLAVVVASAVVPLSRVDLGDADAPSLPRSARPHHDRAIGTSIAQSQARTRSSSQGHARPSRRSGAMRSSNTRRWSVTTTTRSTSATSGRRGLPDATAAIGAGTMRRPS